MNPEELPGTAPEQPTEEILRALKAGEIDAVIGHSQLRLLRLHEVEQALRQSEARYRGIVEDAAELICRWNSDYNLTFVNHTFCEFFGGSVADHIGAPLLNYLGSCEQERAAAHLRLVALDQPPAYFDQRCFAQGERRWIAWTSRALPSQDTGWEGQSIGHDVSQRWRMEEAHVVREALLTSAEQQAGLGSWQLDLKTGQIVQSEQLMRMLAVDEIIGWKELLPCIHADDREDFRKAVTACMENGEPYAVEVRIHSNDGQCHRWMRAQGQAFRDSANSIDRVIGTLLDIHDSRKVKQSLERSRKELEERVRERTIELESRADQLAHLAAELTLAEQRERGRLSEMLHDDLQQILVSAGFHLDLASRNPGLDPRVQELLEQTRGMLNDAVSKSRNLSHELAPPTLRERGLLSAIQWLSKRMEESHHLHIDLDLDRRAEPQSEATRVLLYKCIHELLFNTVKHANTQRAQVTMSREGIELRVIVRDEGVGFDAQAAMTQDGEGGFGLSSIHERIRLLGGSFFVESRIGHGSRFELLVPDRHGTETVAQLYRNQEETVQLRRQDFKPVAATELVHILLVDDHKVMRQGLAALLAEADGMQIVGEAGSGAEAIVRAGELKPEVILMDISMPDMNGIEATRAIKQRWPDITVIGLSMHDEPSLYQEMKRAGAHACMSKALASEDLFDVIHKCRGA